VPPGTTHYALRVSDDGGATWAEHLMELQGTFRLEATDPTQADRILASVDDGQGIPKRLLVSRDGGASFQDYMAVTTVGGVVIASDGRVWIGDGGDRSNLAAPKGIWWAASIDAPLMLLQADYGVGCLTYSEANDTLYACDRWKVGRVDQQHGRFTTLLDLSRVEQFAACEGKDVAALCEAQLCSGLCGWDHFPMAPLCSVYSSPTCGPGSVPDPGGSGGQAGSGGRLPGGAGAPAPAAARRKASGCGIAPIGPSPLAAVGSGVLAWVLVMRRRRARARFSRG
jgi:hypothetical protein